MQEKFSDSFIQEIKDRFRYMREAWREVRDEAATDMRYVSGDPWEPAERQQRIAMKRPVISADELGQYLNRGVNNLRLNPIAIKIVPKGSGSNDQKAEFLSDLVRGIEYKSVAQAAYVTAAENMFSRSYGYFRISRQYINERSFNQELIIRRIANPDTVWLDPDAKEADWSDMADAFITDTITKVAFRARFKNAKMQDFTTDEARTDTIWVQDKTLTIAEYWKVKKEQRKLLEVESPEGIVAVFEDEIQDYKARFERTVVKRERNSERRVVTQCMTNGLEVLEQNEWLGKWIPIIPVVGKELWVPSAGGSKRQLMSLVRLAREPYMLYCYARTAQAETVGQTPKTKWLIEEGQIAGHEDEWANANISPITALVWKSSPEAAGGQRTPPPQRIDYNPPIDSLETLAEASRRAIQSAMGITPLPTAAQRRNEKSGVALQEISQEQDLGSFHFVDNYKKALEHAGRVIVDLIPKVYDWSGDVAVKREDGEHAVVKINQPTQDENGQTINFNIADEDFGEHDVTISTGPSDQSQRDAADKFLDVLAGIPELFARVADLVVKAKGLGAIGNEIADRLTPPEFAKEGSPQQAAAQAQQAGMQLQQLGAFTQQLQQELAKLQQEKQGKVIEMQGRMEIEKIHADTQIAIAEINTKSQEVNQRIQWLQEVWTELHGSAHEAAQQAQEHAQNQQLAAQQHQQALEQGQQQAANQSAQSAQNAQQQANLAPPSPAEA